MVSLAIAKALQIYGIAIVISMLGLPEEMLPRFMQWEDTAIHGAQHAEQRSDEKDPLVAEIPRRYRRSDGPGRIHGHARHWRFEGDITHDQKACDQPGIRRCFFIIA